MKKSTILILFLFALGKLPAQDYLLNFKGTGESVTVDSVKIENLTQCKNKTIGGNDTLHLLGTIGIYETNKNVDNKMRVYPTPVVDNCSLEYEKATPVMATIELYDITGKRIAKEKAILTEGIHKFNISGLVSGIYFLRINSDKYSYTAKILCVNTRESTFHIDYKGKLVYDRNQKLLSNTGNVNNSGGKRFISVMQYTSGDRLKLTGYSGNVYRTILMLVPVNSQSVVLNFVNCTDADGNHYKVVQIGTQIWMAENLRTTRYQNNDNIQNVISNTVWSGLSTGAYCNYNNTSNYDTINIYGRLYNWYAINDSRNISPTGWHIPSDAEWIILSDFLGGMDYAGGKLKDKCSNLWHSPNTGATNETGFTSFPGGYRFQDGTFDEFGTWCVWWTSTSSSVSGAPTRALFFDDNGLGRDVSNKKDGFALRCIKN
jgi:uncharacterized protein (TIGR02145 family)